MNERPEGRAEAARTAALVASREWCMRMARIEDDAGIGAGRYTEGD